MSVLIPSTQHSSKNASFTLGINARKGARMFLLYISAHISNPPSIQRFLKYKKRLVHSDKVGPRSEAYRSAPAASTVTSGTLSDRRFIKAPTTFLP